MRTPQQVERSIAGCQLRLHRLKAELKAAKAHTLRLLLADIDAGMGARAVMKKYRLNRNTLATFMHQHGRYFIPTPPLKTLPDDQRRLYRRLRDRGHPRDVAFAAATSPSTTRSNHGQEKPAGAIGADSAQPG